MRWVTREHVKVDRVACPWLIRRFIDQGATFEFLPKGTDFAAMQKDGEVETYDCPGGRFGHEGDCCTFQTLLAHFRLEGDKALVRLGTIVQAADTDKRDAAPEGAGLFAVAFGMPKLCRDDHDVLARESIVYDALYAYCQELVKQGKA